MSFPVIRLDDPNGKQPLRERHPCYLSSCTRGAGTSMIADGTKLQLGVGAGGVLILKSKRSPSRETGEKAKFGQTRHLGPSSANPMR